MTAFDRAGDPAKTAALYRAGAAASLLVVLAVGWNSPLPGLDAEALSSVARGASPWGVLGIPGRLFVVALGLVAVSAVYFAGGSVVAVARSVGSRNGKGR